MSPRLPDSEFRDGAFRFPLRVYYEDTDFSGLVYHANYLKFFERGRSEALRFTGLSHHDLLGWDTPCALVVRKMEIEFLRPARVEDALEVVSVFTDMRGARFRVNQTILRDGEALCRAQVEAALITLDGRPKKFPPALLEAMAPFLGTAAP